MKDMTQGQIHLIGAGPGDPELLTLRAHRAIAAADVLLHDRLGAREILDLAPPEADRMDLGGDGCRSLFPPQEVAALMIEMATAGRRVVRLRGGDPMLFGGLHDEALALQAAGRPFEIVPGITQTQAVAASTRVPLTREGYATRVCYLDAHPTRLARSAAEWRRLADPDTTLVLHKGTTRLQDVARNLMRNGLPAGTPAMAVAAVATEQEVRVVSTLCHLPSILARRPMPAATLVVIGRVVDLHATVPPSDVDVLFA